MAEVKIELQQSQNIPNISNGINLLIEFFEINNIHPSDGISIASNFILNGFLNEDEGMFEAYLASMKKAYEMNRIGKI